MIDLIVTIWGDPVLFCLVALGLVAGPGWSTVRAIGW